MLHVNYFNYIFRILCYLDVSIAIILTIHCTIIQKLYNVQLKLSFIGISVISFLGCRIDRRLISVLKENVLDHFRFNQRDSVTLR